MIRILAAAASNVGKVRERNEDNLFLNGHTLPVGETAAFQLSDEAETDGVYAVCDGMGGEEHGTEASTIAVDELHALYKKMREHREALHVLADQFTHDANARICEAIDHIGKRMGTTFVLLCMWGKLAQVFNLGDSRAYLLRNGSLTQLSKDHTRVRSLVDIGVLTEDQAKIHPERHVLTQHLGIHPEEMIVEPFHSQPFECWDGDTLLLCSDGLTDMLDDQQIEGVLSQHADPKQAAETLIEGALQNGGKDNVTVVVVRIVL